MTQPEDRVGSGSSWVKGAELEEMLWTPRLMFMLW